MEVVFREVSWFDIRQVVGKETAVMDGDLVQYTRGKHIVRNVSERL
jgi:hypothetical protein